MRCDQARDRIGLLLDGELAGGDRHELSSHAADCPDCARYREELERLRGVLKPMREPAPRALMQRVRASLAVEAAAADAAPPAPQAAARSLSVVPNPTLMPAPRAWAGRVGLRLQPYLRQIAAVLVACAVSVALTGWWMQRAN